MKNLIIIFAVMVTFFTLGCKKDDNNNSSLSAGKSRVSLTASGATSGNFSSIDLTSTVAKSSYEINLSANYVNTTTFTSEMVMMLLPADIAVGTYNLSTLSTVLPTFSYSKGTTGWAAGPGDNFTIVVTKATATEIEGTFSGTAHNDDDMTTVTISNGKFYAVY